MNLNLDLLNKMRMEKVPRIESPKWLMVIYGDESHGKKSQHHFKQTKVYHSIPYIDPSTKMVWVPVVWDSRHISPSNTPFHFRGIPGIQTNKRPKTTNLPLYMGVSKNSVFLQNGWWKSWKILLKWDDLGCKTHYFSETSIICWIPSDWVKKQKHHPIRPPTLIESDPSSDPPASRMTLLSTPARLSFQEQKQWQFP